MHEMIQPLILIPTTQTQMFVVGLLQFILCSAFMYLIARCCKCFSYQHRVVKFVIITHILAWLSLIGVGLFIVPNEINGSYLDVYANLALANIGFMMLPLSVCEVLLVSKPKIGIVFTLFFAAIFGAIGGKGIGDLVSPKPMHAQIDWLSFNETDKRLSSLVMGLANTDNQQRVSTKLAKKLQQDGVLNGIDFSESDGVEPPIYMDLVQAPYTEVVYLPEDYAFTQFGKKLFYSLLSICGVIILTAFIMLLMVKPHPNQILKASDK